MTRFISRMPQVQDYPERTSGHVAGKELPLLKLVLRCQFRVHRRLWLLFFTPPHDDWRRVHQGRWRKDRHVKRDDRADFESFIGCFYAAGKLTIEIHVFRSYDPHGIREDRWVRSSELHIFLRFPRWRVWIATFTGFLLCEHTLTGVFVMVAIIGVVRPWLLVPQPLVIIEDISIEKLASAYGISAVIAGLVTVVFGALVGKTRR